MADLKVLREEWKRLGPRPSEDRYLFHCRHHAAMEVSHELVEVVEDWNAESVIAILEILNIEDDDLDSKIEIARRRLQYSERSLVR